MLCAVGAFAVAAPGVAQAMPDRAAGPPTTNVDITELPKGERLNLAYFSDSAIHKDDVTTPIDQPVRSFVQLDGSYVYQVPSDDAPGKSEIHWASKTGRHKKLMAERRYSEPFSNGYDEAGWIWQRKGPITNGNWLSEIHTANQHGKLDGTYGGPESDHPFDIVGNSTPGWVLDPQGDEPVQITTGKDLEAITYPDTIGATTASHYADGVYVAGLVKRYDDQSRPCTATAEIGLEGEKDELWQSCERTPISYSPDAEWAVLVDSRSDGLGRSELFVAELRTGEIVRKIEVDLNQRLAWEPVGDLVLDAWKGDRMALVRCDLDAGACERTTPIERSAPESDPAFLLPRM